MDRGKGKRFPLLPGNGGFSLLDAKNLRIMLGKTSHSMIRKRASDEKSQPCYIEDGSLDAAQWNPAALIGGDPLLCMDGKVEGSTLTELAFHPDLFLQIADQLFCDCKAETAAGLHIAAASVEALKHMGQVLF